jgi:hypothetical protein
VQIFTKRGHGAPTVDASVQAGSYGARNGDVAIRGGGRLGSYSVGGSAGRTDGIYDFNNQYKNGSLSGAFTFTPDDATSVVLSSRYMAGEYHFPTDGNGVPFDSTAFTSQHRLTVALDASRELVSGVRLHLIGTTNEGHDLSRHDETTTTGGTTTLEQTFEPAKSYRRGGEVRLAVTSFPAALVTVGGQFERNFQQSRNQVVTTTTPGGATSTITTRDNARDTRGAYGAVQGTPLSWLAYDASLRYDSQPRICASRTAPRSMRRRSTPRRGARTTIPILPCNRSVHAPSTLPSSRRCLTGGCERAWARLISTSVN